MITLDGIGNITGGSLDQSGTGTGPITITGGTYNSASTGAARRWFKPLRGQSHGNSPLPLMPKVFLARLTANGVTADGHDGTSAGVRYDSDLKADTL